MAGRTIAEILEEARARREAFAAGQPIPTAPVAPPAPPAPVAAPGPSPAAATPTTGFGSAVTSVAGPSLPGADPNSPLARIIANRTAVAPGERLADAAGRLGANVAGLGARVATAALSPVQIGQDVLFATTAGALDPEMGILDYYQRMEWGNYVPWNRAPERPVSGERLAQLAGIRNETAARWVGLGLDFLADPLIGGATLRAVSKLPRLANMAADLNRAANVLDTMSESLMLVGGVPTARVVAAARRLPGFQQFADAAHTGFVQRYIAPVIEKLDMYTAQMPLGQGAQRNAITPRSGQEFSWTGLFAPGRGRAEGAQDFQSLIGGAAEELAENTSVLLMQAMAAAGDNRWKQWAARYQQGLSVLYDLPVKQINSFQEVTTRAIMNRAYTAAEELGYVAIREAGGVGVRSASVTPSPSDIMRRATRDLEQIENVMMATPLDAASRSNIARRRKTYDQLRQEVYDVALRNEGTPAAAQQAADAFDTVIERFQQASALDGYFGSGYAILHEEFLGNMAKRLSSLAARDPRIAQAIQQAGGEARVAGTAWRRLLSFGARGRADDAILEQVPMPGANLLARTERFTYQDMFGEFSKLEGLPLGTWLNSLYRGHMRRTFGVFQDESSWRRAVESMRTGRTTPVAAIDDQKVLARLQGQFPMETQIMRDYIADILPKASSKNRAVGAFIRQEEVARHMAARNVPPDQIRDFYKEMLRVADPEIARFADRLEQYGAANIGDPMRPDGAARTITGSRQVLGASRQDLEGEYLSTLMEMMDPVLSRIETGAAANRAMRFNESSAQLFRMARQRGLIQRQDAGPAPKGWLAIADGDEGLYPLLAGNREQGVSGYYAHPIIAREFRNLARSPKQPGALAWMRSVITAGYLANPATTTANVAGGFWTAMQYGIDPIKLMGNMVEVYRDWRKQGRNLPELAHTRDILQGASTQTELLQHADDIRAGVFGLREGIQGIGDALTKAQQRYQEWMRRPGGHRATGILGLGAFEISESLFRLGTFRMVMKETGGNIDEARRAARFVVFDYANQPGAVQMLRDTGVFLFPAFPYFMAGRTLSAMYNRPGLLAVGDRAAEFVNNLVVPDEEQRTAMLAILSATPWMRDDKFVPVRNQENGDLTMLSLNQILPTFTLTGSPLVDSIRSLGLWGPTFDLLAGAAGSLNLGGSGGDPGEAITTGQFNRRVLPEGVRSFVDDRIEAVGGLTSFAFNSFAPGFLRKLVRPPEDYDQEWTGLIPEIIRSAQPVPPEWGNTGRTIQEMATRRADQDVWDAVLSATIRSTRVVATEGPLADMTTVLVRASNALERDMNLFEEQILLAERRGDTNLAAAIRARKERTVQQYWERWGAIIREARRMSDQGRFDPPGR